MSQRQKLDTVAQDVEMHGCNQEPCQTCRNYVFGEGDSNAVVIFIGEAPGENEDKEGVPFIGRSGVFLDALLKRAGLERSEVYITNVLKARPPKNRDPTPGEVEHHKPWLDKQIEIIDPAVIVPLGRFALEFFSPGHKITDVHGLLMRHPSVVLTPWFHPSAGLRDMKIKDSLLADAKMLATYIDDFVY